MFDFKFDLLLAFILLAASIFAGLLSRVTLLRSGIIHPSFLSSRKFVIITIVVTGLIGGLGMMIAMSALAIVFGEALTAARLIVAFIEGFVPMTAGVLIGFSVIGSRLR